MGRIGRMGRLGVIKNELESCQDRLDSLLSNLKIQRPPPRSIRLKRLRIRRRSPGRSSGCARNRLFLSMLPKPRGRSLRQ